MVVFDSVIVVSFLINDVKWHHNCIFAHNIKHSNCSHIIKAIIVIATFMICEKKEPQHLRARTEGVQLVSV